MGCASSTPMIATAGSEVLKAATHVADDAGKRAGEAAKDVTEALGKTLDNTKETVGTAVTGIAQELGNVFKDKTNALDEAKNHPLENLHSTEGEIEKHTLGEEHLIAIAPTDVEESASRAPTPTGARDADSLKTSTPEPEIEQAMSNCPGDNPPTPKPTFAELEQLKAVATTGIESAVIETYGTVTAIATAATAVITTATADHDEINKAQEADPSATDAPPVEASTKAEQKRPSTTDWEKYADLLAQMNKTHPQGPFRRGGQLRRFGQQANPPLPPQPTFWRDNTTVVHSTTIAHNRLREDESAMSDINYNSYSSPIHSNRSSAVGPRRKLPHTLTRTTARKFQREFASVLGPGTYSTAGGGGKYRRPLLTQNKSPNLGRKFDFNPNRERVHSSPTKKDLQLPTRSRIGSPIHTKTVLLSSLGTPAISKLQSPMQNKSSGNNRVEPPTHLPILSTKNRALRSSHKGSPLTTKTASQAHLNSPNTEARRSGTQSSLLLESNLGSMPHKNLAKMDLSSPINNKELEQCFENGKRYNQPKPSKYLMDEHTSKPLKENSNPIGEVIGEIRSKSSRSSTNSSLIIKSHPSPLSSSSHSKASMLEEIAQTQLQTNSPTVECSRSHTPIMGIYGIDEANYYGVQIPNGRSGNSSSFLTTPRTSPFSIRKDYAECSDKENKAAFVSDLSSVSDQRLLVSPYKLRDRCTVCHKKYVIK